LILRGEFGGEGRGGDRVHRAVGGGDGDALRGLGSPSPAGLGPVDDEPKTGVGAGVDAVVGEDEVAEAVGGDIGGKLPGESLDQ